MQETTQQQITMTKQQAGQKMNLNYQEKHKELSSATTANQLKTLTHTNQQRKINDKDVDFLVKQLGMDKIKATNILKKLDLKQAVKFIVNN